MCGFECENFKMVICKFVWPHKIRLQYTHCELNVPSCMHNNQLSIAFKTQGHNVFTTQSKPVLRYTIADFESRSLCLCCTCMLVENKPLWSQIWNREWWMVNGAVGLCERHLINCCFLSGNCESKLLCKVSAGLFQSAVVLCRVVSCRVVSCRVVSCCGTSGSGTNTIPQPPYHSHHTTATIPQPPYHSWTLEGILLLCQIFPKVICLRDLISSGAEGLAG